MRVPNDLALAMLICGVMWGVIIWAILGWVELIGGGG